VVTRPATTAQITATESRCFFIGLPSFATRPIFVIRIQSRDSSLWLA
jgi:hypothetical protein